MFKSNNIIKRLTLLFMSIVIILTTIPIQSLMVYAEGETVTVSQTDVAVIVADIAGKNGIGGSHVWTHDAVTAPCATGGRRSPTPRARGVAEG